VDAAKRRGKERKGKEKKKIKKRIVDRLKMYP
jgi:hypothetical protein